MTTEEFFAEAKRLNLRMLGTPEETRAALDLKDAEIERLNAALKKANEQAERFERGWYLRGDALERMPYPACADCVDLAAAKQGRLMESRDA